MNVSTYAKLTKPPQFRPNEEAKFRLEYSQDLSCLWASLKIYGYTLRVDGGGEYSGTTITHYINISMAGVGITEFVVPPNTLGEIPADGSQLFWHSGNMKAVVEIGSEFDENGNVIPLYKSNEIFVDMLMGFDNDLYLYPQNEVLVSTGSSYKTNIYYIERETFGSFEANDLNSYQVFLYDSDRNLIKDSGIKYDWNNNIYANHFYPITDLQDNTTYYIKVKATLMGGYVFTTDYRELQVKYADEPIVSPYLSLENDKVHGRVNLTIKPNVAYDKIVISRTVKDLDDYLEIKTVNRSKSTTEEIKVYDYYALPKTTYTYKVVLFNGDNVADIYYNSITHEFDGVCIADAYNGYNALAFDKKYPVSKNDRASIVEPMDSTYPISLRSNQLDYDSGSVSATFAYIDKCEPDFANNVDYSKSIRHWLNNGRVKLLKYYNGECWLVEVSGITDDDPKGNDVIVTSFNWTEVGNVKDNSEYLRLGLILNE